MANELDELLGMVTSDADRTALQQILARNPVAQERAEAQAALFAALATGDNAAIASAQTRFQQANQPANTTTQPAATSAAATLDELTRMVTQQVNSAITAGGYTKKEDVEALATAKAEELFKAKSGELLATAAQTADQITQIRSSHYREFGSELDTAKFTEHLNANAGKYGSLAAAHDAYVNEERVQARIAKGVADGLAANVSSNSLPGTSLINSQSTVTPLPGMMRANELRINPNAATNGEGRGTALDAAVKAWRQTASGGNSAATN